MKIIELKNVDFKYDKSSNNYAIKDLTFSVESGEFLCVLGRNGSGKSTVARLINGLLKKDSGEINVLGYNVDDTKNLFEIRKNVGMVFQNPDNQMVATIVEDDIAFGPENLGVAPNEIGERIDYALKVTGMEEYRNSQSHRLSGGQKQRIAIASVLAMQPKIIIFDESTSMLDPKGRKEVLNIIKDLNSKGITIIYITHYMDEVINANRVLVMDNGEIKLQGTPLEIFSTKNLQEYGLELPRSVYIKNRLKENGYNIDENILQAESLGEELCKLLQKT